MIEPKILKQLKSKLGKEKRHLKIELDKLKVFHDYGQSEDANAQEMEELEESLALRRNLQKLYDDTTSALNKIDQNRFGVCEKCGQIINIARLKAYPSTRYCVKDEATKKQR